MGQPCAHETEEVVWLASDPMPIFSTLQAQHAHCPIQEGAPPGAFTFSIPAPSQALFAPTSLMPPGLSPSASLLSTVAPTTSSMPR